MTDKLETLSPAARMADLLEVFERGRVAIMMDELPIAGPTTEAEDPFPETPDEAVVLEYQKLVSGETSALPWERGLRRAG